MDMGQKIYSLRIQKGLTLEELGNMVGVGKSTVRKWENGMIANMKRDKILKVSEVLDTTPAYLMGWKEEEHPEESSPKIMHYYELLNDIGKHEATKRVEEMTHAPQYMREDVADYLAVRAAHNDADTTDEELEKMERDSKTIVEMLKNKRK